MLLTEQKKSLLDVVIHYSKNLSEQAKVYLEGRGISEQVANQFSLGTITDPINGHEAFEGWLCIPYFTALGDVSIVKFRRLDDGKPKYGQPIGQKTHLYNVADTIIDSHRIVICEGELDAVVLSGVLGIPAVGVPGVASWKNYYAKLFNGFDTVYIAGDNDIKEDGSNPGAEFSRRVASDLLNGQIVQLPAGMDINDYYLAHGLEQTANLVGGINV